MLFHISEDPDIEIFIPRVPDAGGDPVVWAIAEERIQNYLLPRDCPRVTFYATDESSQSDINNFLGPNDSVVAVERGWVDRIKTATIYRYHVPETSFKCTDKCAGYFQSEEAVIPTKVDIIDDVLLELSKRSVEVRILDDLWLLHDAVASSTLAFSMIRMRNATPRS